MTLSINGNDIGQAIEIALTVGGIVAMLVIGLLVYLVVRPPRRRRVEVRPEPEAVDADELLVLMDRMERRLEVLERALGDDSNTDRQTERKQLLEAGAGPAMRRTK